MRMLRIFERLSASRAVTVATPALTILWLAEGCPLLPTATEFAVADVAVALERPSVAVGGTRS